MHNLVQRDRTKHVEIGRHFIKEKLDDGIIYTMLVKTREKAVVILTKGVSSRVSYYFKQVGHVQYLRFTLRGNVGIHSLDTKFVNVCPL